MVSLDDSASSAGTRGAGSPLARRRFGPLVAAADAVIILAVALVTGVAYHEAMFGSAGNLRNYLEFGGLVALFFCGANIARGTYVMANYITTKRHFSRTFALWNVTFLVVFTVTFLTKSGDIYSRGAVILFYAAGLTALGLVRIALIRHVVLAAKTGRMASQRVLLVGAEADVMAFARRYQPWNLGLQVVGMSTLTDTSDPATLARDLDRAVETARAHRPDDVYVVVPWQDTEVIERTVDALMTIPVAIHLAPERILDRFDDVGIAKIGPMASLELTRQPLTTFEVVTKRLFDIVAASLALVLLAPAFFVVAVLIKRDSKGPVLFRQTRYGFNQKPFQIFKFRTMTTMDDGKVVAQAKRDDPRITRVGAFLRRWNIDELPQLLNVLRGDMSIVGPRPHAVAHNRAFEGRIALYARRHNVKPGITGWAQVNGFRGETDTDEKMAKRVEYDLYYIDNWSLLFDVRICVLTLVSPKAFRNAY